MMILDDMEILEVNLGVAEVKEVMVDIRQTVTRHDWSHL
jgi:hypothetical protein